MLVAHHFCTVEAVRIGPTPSGEGDELVVEGWFLAHSVVSAMRLMVVGVEPEEIVDRERASDDVGRAHGTVFGERAWCCRFRHTVALGPIWPDLTTAELHVMLLPGELFAIALGAAISFPAPSETERALFAAVQSIGADPELGRMQAALGIDRPDLLRAADVADVFALASAIERGFTELGRPGALSLDGRDPEWVIRARGAAVGFRSGLPSDAGDRDTVLEAERRRLVSAAARFVADCRDPSTVFVYRPPDGPDGTLGIDRLHGAIRSVGPARLLWVGEATGEDAHATVRELGQGLHRGFIAGPVRAEARARFSRRRWLELLGAASRAFGREPIGAGPRSSAPEQEGSGSGP